LVFYFYQKLAFFTVFQAVFSFQAVFRFEASRQGFLFLGLFLVVLSNFFGYLGALEKFFKQ
jgi:hypothetical protein